MKEVYIGNTIDNVSRKDRRTILSTLRSRIINEIDLKWENLDYRLRLLSGKQILKKLFEVIKKIHLSITKILKFI